MKKIALTIAICLLPAIAMAQATPNNYTSTSTSVTSTSTPTCVLPVARMTTWTIGLRKASTNPVLCWAYTGSSCPGSAPAGCASPSGNAGAGCQEVIPGGSINDAVSCDSATCTAGGMGQGWACILETSGAETVDSTYR